MLIPGKGDIPGFDVIVPHFCGRLFDASSEVRLCSSLSFLHDAFNSRLFRIVHEPGLLDQAAYGCLKPPPTGLAPKGQSIGPTGIDNPPSSFVQHDAFPHLHVTITLSLSQNRI